MKLSRKISLDHPFVLLYNKYSSLKGDRGQMLYVHYFTTSLRSFSIDSFKPAWGCQTTITFVLAYRHAGWATYIIYNIFPDRPFCRDGHTKWRGISVNKDGVINKRERCYKNVYQRSWFYIHIRNLERYGLATHMYRHLIARSRGCWLYRVVLQVTSCLRLQLTVLTATWLNFYNVTLSLNS